MGKLILFLICLVTVTVSSAQTCAQEGKCECNGQEKVEQTTLSKELTKKLLMSKSWKYGDGGETVTFEHNYVGISNVKGELLASFDEWELDGNIITARKGTRWVSKRAEYLDEDCEIPGAWTFYWDGERVR